MKLLKLILLPALSIASAATTPTLQVSAVGSSATSTSTIDTLFRNGVHCADLAWRTTRTNLANLAVQPIYYYDAETKEFCKDDGASCEVLNIDDKMFGDLKLRVSDLVGYTSFYHQHLGREFLVLTKRVSDFRTRSSSPQNLTLLDQYRSTVKACEHLITPNSLPLSTPRSYFDESLSNEGISGFAIHEQLHMFQRRWPEPNYDQNVADRELAKIEFWHSLDRLIFHLRKHNLNYKSSVNDAAKDLGAAKTYYEILKRDFPNAFTSLDSKFEGVAFYLEASTFACLKTPPSAGDIEFNLALSNYLDLLLNDAGISNQYVLSALSAQALELTKRADWQERLESTVVSPTDVLFETVTALPTESQSDNLPLLDCLYPPTPM